MARAWLGGGIAREGESADDATARLERAKEAQEEAVRDAEQTSDGR